MTRHVALEGRREPRAGGPWQTAFTAPRLDKHDAARILGRAARRGSGSRAARPPARRRVQPAAREGRTCRRPRRASARSKMRSMAPTERRVALRPAAARRAARGRLRQHAEQTSRPRRTTTTCARRAARRAGTAGAACAASTRRTVSPARLMAAAAAAPASSTRATASSSSSSELDERRGVVRASPAATSGSMSRAERRQAPGTEHAARSLEPVRRSPQHLRVAAPIAPAPPRSRAARSRGTSPMSASSTSGSPSTW